MEKFPILCTLSALVVFFGAAASAAGVQTGKSNTIPFGSNSVGQIQRMAESLGQDLAAFGKLALPGSKGIVVAPAPGVASRDGTSVRISGDLLVSF